MIEKCKKKITALLPRDVKGSGNINKIRVEVCKLKIDSGTFRTKGKRGGSRSAHLACASLTVLG